MPSWDVRCVRNKFCNIEVSYSLETIWQNILKQNLKIFQEPAEGQSASITCPQQPKVQAMQRTCFDQEDVPVLHS